MRGSFRLLSLFAVVCFGLANTDAWAVESSFHFKAGYDFGGDTLTTVVFQNGDTESVKANEGFFLAAGLALVNAGKNIETEISLGYKFGGSVASNGDVTFTSLPAELLVFHRWSAVRVGGGLVYYLSPELDVSGAGGTFASDTDFDNASGFVLQADYRVTEKLNVGLRYTSVDFEPSNSNASFDGNTFGLVFSGSL